MKTRGDAYSPSYVLVACAFMALILLSVMFDLSFSLALLLLFTFAVWIVVVLVRLVANLYAKRWRRVVSIVAAPTFVCFLVWARLCTGVSLDMARLFLWRSSYMSEVATHPVGNGHMQFGMWSWTHQAGGFGNPDWNEVLIYDSSDQIALPRKERTADWYRVADATGYRNHILIHPELIMEPEAFDNRLRVLHLDGHFYLCGWTL